MKPLDYFSSLSEDEKLAYASRAGCSIHHMRMNLFVRAGAKKQPRAELIVGLVTASEGNVSLKEAIDYFLVEPVLKLANGAGVAQPSQDCAAPLVLEAMPPRHKPIMKGFDAVQQVGL